LIPDKAVVVKCLFLFDIYSHKTINIQSIRFFRRPSSDKTNKSYQILSDKKMLPPGGVPNGNYLSKVVR
jgi:hypothetical protein